MNRQLIPLLLAATGHLTVASAQPEHFSFPVPPAMTRAEVYLTRTVPRPKGVLVLCPGWNGNGKSLARDANWISFAERNDLGILATSFASDPQKFYQGDIYYKADQGSGQVLLDAVQKAFGKDLPIVIYGFSAGADFVSHFVQWRPDRVVAWCAYSPVSDFDGNAKTVLPPGLMACGDLDPRLGGALMNFKQGRAMGNRWMWLNVAGSAHTPDPKAIAFIRDYLQKLIGDATGTGVWVDIDTAAILSAEKAKQEPSLSGWLPDEQLLRRWKELNPIDQ